MDDEPLLNESPGDAGRLRVMSSNGINPPPGGDTGGAVPAGAGAQLIPRVTRTLAKRTGASVALTGSWHSTDSQTLST